MFTGRDPECSSASDIPGFSGSLCCGVARALNPLNPLDSLDENEPFFATFVLFYVFFPPFLSIFLCFFCPVAEKSGPASVSPAPPDLHIFCKGRQAFQPSRENTMMHHQQQQQHRARKGYREKKARANPSERELLISNQGACCNSICTLTSYTLLQQQMYTLHTHRYTRPLNINVAPQHYYYYYYYLLPYSTTARMLVEV